MKFGKRLGILESNSHVCEYTPPIIIHTIVKPSESGPKEIGVFANVITLANTPISFGPLSLGLTIV